VRVAKEASVIRHLTFMLGLVVVSTVAGFGEGVGEAQRQGASQIEPLPPVPHHLMFVATDVAERMLELANVTKDDVVYDLGCGEGRLAILAAKRYGARSVGVDNDPKRIVEAKAKAEEVGVSNLVRFVQQETIDVSGATVVTMVVPQSVPWLTEAGGLLQPTLTRQLKAGARIVTNFVAGSMKAWKPDQVDHFSDPHGKARAILYLWKHDGTIRP
jgi:predicted RNA methylase